MEGKVCISQVLLMALSQRRKFKLPVYLKKFSAMKTHVDRVNFAYKDLKECGACPPFSKDEKNDAMAVSKREIGNVFFTSGNYREALDSYTTSIMFAKSKTIVALAYANRSAALYKLGLHKECLVDIARALENGYPDHLKSKLIDRRKHCEAQKTVDQKCYEPLPKFPDSEKNSLIECARNNVKITKNPKYGRCVEATRNIEIGEVLAIEQPFAVIVKDEDLVHCHECFELCYNMIPCDNCTKTLYCGDDCKIKAFDAYHKYECPILLSLEFIMIDNPKRLALKIVFLVKNELEKFSTYGTEANEIYRSDRFKEICNLEGHTQHRTPIDLFARAVFAAGLFDLIKNHSTFLQDGVNEDCLKECLLSMILICGINTVDINEMAPQPLGNYDLNPFGIAIYSFFTLFNHSCWPNVVRQYHGTTMVHRAINTIKKGEQCFVVYGPNYLLYTKEFRQTFLANHQFFTCTCKACEENWPMKSFMTGVNSDLDVFMSTIRLSKADVDVAKKELHRLLVKAKKFEKTLPPGQDFAIKDLLTFCYNIFGNKRRI